MKSRLSIFNSNSKGAFAAKCSVFFAFVVLVQAGLTVATGRGDVPAEVQQLDAYVDEGIDILYLGDSSLYTGHAGDEDASSMPEILDALMPNTTVKGVYKAAYTVDMYAEIARHIATKQKRPKVVIFPINLRLFAPQLEKHPYQHFDRVRYFLRHDSFAARMAYRPLAVFKAIPSRSVGVADFELASVFDGMQDLGPLGPFNPVGDVAISEAQRKRVVTFFFMYALQENSTACQNLAGLLDSLQAQGIRPLPYFTPVDYQSCEEYLGPRFIERFAENRAVVKQILAAREVQAVDLSTALDSEVFAWDSYPNQHLKYGGRRFVAEQLRDAAIDLLQ